MAKGLILKGDQQLELVLLCAAKPTVAMLKDVAEKLEAQLEVKRSVLFSLSPSLLRPPFKIVAPASKNRSGCRAPTQ